MEDAVIIAAVRTPIGRYGGSLKDMRPDDLAALVVGEAIRRAAIDPASVEDVLLGCANQAGEDNRNVARMALLLAGLPVEVAGQTINRLCGSGLQAINSAAQAIQTGTGDTFVAGGVESMTRAPFVLGKSDAAFNRTMHLQDTTLGWRFINSKLSAMFTRIAWAKQQRTLQNAITSVVLIRMPTRCTVIGKRSPPNNLVALRQRLCQ